MAYFDFIEKVNFEGKESKNPMAFRYYDKDRVILGKKMSEHLPFAMAWWHTLGACGVDMFGAGTADKSFESEKATMAHAKAKVDAGFEFMSKMGIEYFCFHDVDLVPEDEDINVTNARLDEISDYILVKMPLCRIDISRKRHPLFPIPVSIFLSTKFVPFCNTVNTKRRD